MENLLKFSQGASIGMRQQYTAIPMNT